MEDNDFDFDGSLDLPDSYEGIAEHENFKNCPPCFWKKSRGENL